MKIRLRGMLHIFLALAFFACAGMLTLQLRAYQAADALYADAMETAGLTAIPDMEVPLAELPEDAETEAIPAEAQSLTQVDLAALRARNDQVLGWICIPGTQLSYPLMASADNSEYLRLAWDGTANSAGSIFLSCGSNADFEDFNTLIYGHRMQNGSMFASLKYYAKQDYLDAHPCVYIVTDDALLRYEIYAAYEASVDGDAYRVSFPDEASRQAALDLGLSSSSVQSGLTPTMADHILTLSTCTGRGDYSARWVVQAALTGHWPIGA